MLKKTPNNGDPVSIIIDQIHDLVGELAALAYQARAREDVMKEQCEVLFEHIKSLRDDAIL